MTNQGGNENENVYSPAEAAELLGVNVERLRQMRLQGRIKGSLKGNTTVYTLKQIKEADVSPWKRGRKSKRRGQDDEESGISSSVVLKRKSPFNKRLLALATGVLA